MQMSNQIKYKKIFIMTLPRSGSTLLGLILGGHSKIINLGETMYWELLNPQQTTCSCGKFNCKNLNKPHNLINKNHLSKPLLKAWQIVDKKYWPDKIINSYSIIQGSTVTSSSLDYWVKRCKISLEKIITVYKKFYTRRGIYVTNDKLFHIGESLSRDKSWGVIILLRNPLDIMSSYKNAGIRKKDFRSACSVLPFCYDFLQSVKRISNKENVTIIKYENLCKHPEGVVKDICEFIGIDYQDAMVDFIRHPIDKRGHILKGNRMLYNNMKKILIKTKSGWRKNLTNNEVEELQHYKELIDLYKYFNYKL